MSGVESERVAQQGTELAIVALVEQAFEVGASDSGSVGIFQIGGRRRWWAGCDIATQRQAGQHRILAKAKLAVLVAAHQDEARRHA